jgi:hypothetical protein
LLFLRRQPSLYVERGVKPMRIDASTRVSLALLSQLLEWRSALVAVRPETLIRGHPPGLTDDGGPRVRRKYWFKQNKASNRHRNS